MNRKDFILGASSGYNAGELAPFVESARRFCPAARVVLFVERTDAATTDYLKSRGVEVCQVRMHRRPWAGFFDRRPNGRAKLLRLLGVLKLQRPFIKRTCGLASARFLCFRDYLKKQVTGETRVLMTDVRDVLFQADFFARLSDDSLYAALEDPTVLIGAPHDNNFTWLKNEFNAETAEALRGRINSCVGTVAACGRPILKYLDEFAHLLGECRLWHYGYDQAIHNVIVQRRLIPQTVLHPNESGPVLSMCNMSPDRVKMDAEGFVVDKKGVAYPLLHHYDRFPALLEAVQRTFHARPRIHALGDNSL